MAMEQIEVKILDRIFKLQVPATEKPRLMNAVRIVDKKMREIRDTSMAHGMERIAVHAALQITYEFLGQPADTTGTDSEQVQALINQLNAELDSEIRRHDVAVR
ncbi:MAG: cell division protein ZapA [Lautropia sp.]|nr:cell division protein ZapA [Lautropia sp.]